MPIPLVQVRHKTTGQKTFLPETSLRHMPDYVRTPSQKARDEVPDGTAFPAAGVEETALQAPPRTGAGSGLEPWLTYAGHRGIDVPDGAGRDDVIALVDAADSGS